MKWLENFEFWQTRNSNFYQSLMDVDNLLRGQSYADLKESYVIFICTQDPFGKGLPVYTFRSVCGEDGSILLNDKSVKVFYFIFHLTFNFIVCIFTVILAGFFLLRYAMPVRGVFLLYTPYCQVFRKAVASLATRQKTKLEEGFTMRNRTANPELRERASRRFAEHLSLLFF